jgi:hypothetical protein
MNMQDFLKTKKFSNTLPQGDTYLTLTHTEITEIAIPNDDGTNRKAFEATTADGEKYILPVSVLAAIQKLLAAGAVRVRITRVGTTKTDTKYTTVKVE